MMLANIKIQIWNEVRKRQQAALQARFSPTMLGEQPVKVSGIITYNFVLQ